MGNALEKFGLTGKTALITGAAGLLGVQHAAALLESGATVVLTDLGEASLASASVSLSGTADPARIRREKVQPTHPFWYIGVRTRSSP